MKTMAMDTAKVAEAKKQIKLRLAKGTSPEILEDIKESTTNLRSSCSMSDGQIKANFSISQDQGGNKGSVYRDFDKTFGSIDAYAEYLKKFFAADPDVEQELKDEEPKKK